MAKRSINLDNLQEAFQAFEQSLNGAANSDLHQVRKKSLSVLKELGLPNNKNEEYKYTNIARQFSDVLSMDIVPYSGDKDEEILQMVASAGDANVLVFINGALSEKFSSFQEEEKFIIKDLASAAKTHADDITRHFNGLGPERLDGFEALNTSFAQHGVFIKVEKSQVVEKPVILYFIKDTTKGEIFTMPRNLFLVDENAQIKITEFFHTFGEQKSFTNTVTEIRVAQHAIVDYYKIEPDRAAAYHVGHTNVSQADNSTFNSVTVTLGGSMIRNNLSIALDGEHCECNMYGLTILRDKQHVDNNTTVDHMKPNSYSNELYKNILDDDSTGVFNGKIFVRQYAQKTNAFQSNRNILLSDDASINTKPQLEIWADDVKCSHGATTGQIDKDQLFYLRARGLSEESAKAMLLYAFAHDVLDNIRIDAIRDSLDEVIAQRLHKDF